VLRSYRDKKLWGVFVRFRARKCQELREKIHAMARIDVEEFLAIKIRMELVFFGTILVLTRHEHHYPFISEPGH
jgi:hypothetical protein